MSDVLENDFFGNVQNTPLESPHLAAIPSPEVAPYETISVETFTSLGHSSLNRQVHGLINQNSKWFYGYSTAGSDVPATPESRMKGLRNILMNFEQYQEVCALNPSDLLKKSHYLSTTRDLHGKSIPIDTLLSDHHEDAVTEVFWDLVAAKDPLIVTLAQIGKRHVLSEAGFFRFSREAIVAFRPAEVKDAVDVQVAAIRKSIGKAAIASE